MAGCTSALACSPSSSLLIARVVTGQGWQPMLMTSLPRALLPPFPASTPMCAPMGPPLACILYRASARSSAPRSGPLVGVTTMVPVEAPQRHARLGVAPPGHAKALVVQVGVPPRGVPGPLLVLARVSALVPVPAWVRVLAPAAPVAPRPSLTPVLALMPVLTLVPVPAPVPVAVPLEAMVLRPRSPLSSRTSASSRQPASSVLLSVTFGTLPLPFLSCASALPLPFPASRPSSSCVIVMVPPTGLPSGTCSVLVPLPGPDGCLVSCPALPSVPTPRTSTASTATMRPASFWGPPTVPSLLRRTGSFTSPPHRAALAYPVSPGPSPPPLWLAGLLLSPCSALTFPRPLFSALPSLPPLLSGQPCLAPADLWASYVRTTAPVLTSTRTASPVVAPPSPCPPRSPWLLLPQKPSPRATLWPTPIPEPCGPSVPLPPSSLRTTTVWTLPLPPPPSGISSSTYPHVPLMLVLPPCTFRPRCSGPPSNSASAPRFPP